MEDFINLSRAEKLKEETKEKRYNDYFERQKDIIKDLKFEISDFKAKHEDQEKDQRFFRIYTAIDI